MKNILLGLVCLDIYTNIGVIRPGCGILHNAFHLQQLGCTPLLMSRIGSDDSEELLNFFRRNKIAILAEHIVGTGISASIEIELQVSGEATISNFRRGVGRNFRLNQAEEEILGRAEHVHLVMVDDMIPEFLRLSRRGVFETGLVSADFLSFEYFTVEQFTELIEYLDIVFIGWKADINHPTIEAIEQAARQRQILVVITLGSRGIQVFDSRDPVHFPTRFFEVEPVRVQENTNGCGDAFISYFLAEYWLSRHLERAIAQGKIGGAKATGWRYALPDWAYLDK
jgi:sugar/nucleoside kinase (ribokinase family)